MLGQGLGYLSIPTSPSFHLFFVSDSLISRRDDRRRHRHQSTLRHCLHLLPRLHRIREVRSPIHLSQLHVQRQENRRTRRRYISLPGSSQDPLPATAASAKWEDQEALWRHISLRRNIHRSGENEEPPNHVDTLLTG